MLPLSTGSLPASAKPRMHISAGGILLAARPSLVLRGCLTLHQEEEPLPASPTTEKLRHSLNALPEVIWTADRGGVSQAAEACTKGDPEEVMKNQQDISRATCFLLRVSVSWRLGPSFVHLWVLTPLSPPASNFSTLPQCLLRRLALQPGHRGAQNKRRPRGRICRPTDCVLRGCCWLLDRYQ